jgi:hypothetical protein
MAAPITFLAQIKQAVVKAATKPDEDTTYQATVVFENLAAFQQLAALAGQYVTFEVTTYQPSLDTEFADSTPLEQHIERADGEPLALAPRRRGHTAILDRDEGP